MRLATREILLGSPGQISRVAAVSYRALDMNRAKGVGALDYRPTIWRPAFVFSAAIPALLALFDAAFRFTVVLLTDCEEPPLLSAGRLSWLLADSPSPRAFRYYAFVVRAEVVPKILGHRIRIIARIEILGPRLGAAGDRALGVCGR